MTAVKTLQESIKSKEPFGYVNTMLQQVFLSGLLTCEDQESFELGTTRSLGLEHFALELVGSYFNMMLPNALRDDALFGEANVININTFPNLTENVIPFCLYIPSLIHISESINHARKYDLVVDGDISKGPFQLIPKTPRAWEPHIERLGSKYVLLEITADAEEFTSHPGVPKLKHTGHLHHNEIAFAMHWPECATEWLHRYRPSGILDQHALHNIQEKGCHIIRHDSSLRFTDLVCDTTVPENKDTTLWTLTFAVAEREYCMQISDDQRFCFLLFKCLLDKSVIRHDLPNYIATHTFFYACDNIQRSEWKTNKGHCFLILIKHLLRSFNDRFLPHYFIQGRNLLDNLPLSVVLEIYEHMVCTFRNPLLTFYKALDVCNITRSNIGHLIEKFCFETSWHMSGGVQSLTLFSIDVKVKAVVSHINHMVIANNYKAALSVFKTFVTSEDTEVFAKMTKTLSNVIETPKLWCFCVCLDMDTGYELTKDVFMKDVSVHISDVFGEKASSMVLDTCIPGSAAVKNGDLRYPIGLHRMLKNVSKLHASTECLKSYLRRHIDENVYSTTGTGMIKILTPLFKVVYEMHICLYNSCLKTGRCNEYKDFLPHFEKIVKLINTQPHIRKLALI